MKYLLMMQLPLRDWGTKTIEAWPPSDMQAHFDFLKRFNEQLLANGELVRAEGLGGPEQIRIVKANDDGSTSVMDGPFPESKEVLAGYWAIDVDTPERAYEIAAKASAAPGPGGKPLNMEIEVRPVMHIASGKTD
jgi:hypothetical protein